MSPRTCTPQLPALQHDAVLAVKDMEHKKLHVFYTIEYRIG